MQNKNISIHTLYIDKYALGGAQLRIYAIPYPMKPGQAPGDIGQRFRDKWVEIGLKSANTGKIITLDQKYDEYKDELEYSMAGTFFGIDINNKRMDFDGFVKTFKPQINESETKTAPILNGDDDSELFIGFETYGEDLEYVKDFAEKRPNNVFTLIENENGQTLIVPGMRLVNRLAYMLTEVSFDDESLIVDYSSDNDFEKEQATRKARFR